MNMVRDPLKWVFRLVDRAGTGSQARAERGQRRVRQVVFLLGLYVVIAYSAAVTAVIYVDDVRKYADSNLMAHSKIETRRGDITDRNGVTLATSLRADSISADPRWVLPPGVKPVKMPFDSAAGKAFRTQVGTEIATILNAPVDDILARMNRNAGYVYLARHIDSNAGKALRQAVLLGHLPGVTIEPEFVRYYPNNALAGALVGRENTTGSLEASFEQLLRGQQVELRTYKDSTATAMYFDGAPDSGVFSGHSLTLTIDEKIQAVAEHHLEAAVEEFEAEHGIAIVLDVHTGEVLALAQAPGFNPNDTKAKPKYGFHNIAVEFQYEPGSTFKVFNLAIGLEEKAVTLEEVIQTGAPLLVGNKIIKDDHPHGQVTGLQSLQVSSNIANAKIAMRMEREVYDKYLRQLGFGRRLDLGFIGEGAGQLSPVSKWSKVQYANIAFGQGIAVTPLQMVAGFAAIGDGGIWRRPKLIRDVLTADGKNNVLFQVDPGQRVFSEETTKKVLKAMASVCQPRGPDSLGGTGTQARMPNYSIGGKTGTAQQANATGGYSDTHWVGSFIGITPIEKPRLVVLVAIDTPKKYDPKLGKIARYGGIVAAPVVREIARFALPYLGVPPSPGAPYLDKNDPEKAKLQDDLRRASATKAADQTAKTAEAKAPVVAEATAALMIGQVRMPDVLKLPMRSSRELLGKIGLQLLATGSGVACEQDPPAGSVVQNGTAVKVVFRRFSEIADAKPVAPIEVPKGP